MLVLAAVVALVPAPGATLCVTESGHVAIEISCDSRCATAAGGLEVHKDCEDTTLSVGAAHRAVAHVDFDAALLPATMPSGLVAAPVRPLPRAAVAPPASREQTPLLRC